MVVSSLLFGLLYLASYYMLFDIWKLQKTKLDNACESALNIVLSDTTFLLSDTTHLNIGDNRILIETIQRGLMWELVASAARGRYESVIKFLTANKNKFINNKALLITRQNFRGAVTGNTKIVGDFYATTDRISPGRITGIERSGQDYLDGELIKDENVQPNFYDHSYLLKWLDSVELLKAREPNYRENIFLNQSMLDTLHDKKYLAVSGSVTVSDSLWRNHCKYPLSIYASGGVIFENNSVINGGFDFYTDSTIVVNQNCILNNVTLTAEGNCEINNSLMKFSQIFSKRNIKLQNVTCEFPCIVAAYADCSLSENLQNKIELNASAVNGTVMLLCSTIGLSTNKAIISFKSGSRVQGLVYSENFLESDCNVTGTVYTYELFFYKSPTEYRNWLVNTNINNELLDEDFLLPFGFAIPVNAGVIKKEWIN
jgi:hypothetical protein